MFCHAEGPVGPVDCMELFIGPLCLTEASYAFVAKSILLKNGVALNDADLVFAEF